MGEASRTMNAGRHPSTCPAYSSKLLHKSLYDATSATICQAGCWAGLPVWHLLLGCPGRRGVLMLLAQVVHGVELGVVGIALAHVPLCGMHAALFAGCGRNGDLHYIRRL